MAYNPQRRLGAASYDARLCRAGLTRPLGLVLHHFNDCLTRLRAQYFHDKSQVIYWFLTLAIPKPKSSKNYVDHGIGQERFKSLQCRKFTEKFLELIAA